jgi:hypothetical protein
VENRLVSYVLNSFCDTNDTVIPKFSFFTFVCNGHDDMVLNGDNEDEIPATDNEESLA